jgi:hypothetical protein
VAEGVHHFLQGVTAYDAGTATGSVGEVARDDKAVFIGPLGQVFFLLVNGEFLVFVAAIAQVGEDG